MNDIEKKIDVLFELGRYKEVLELGYKNLYTKELDKEMFYQYIILAHMNSEEYQKALEMSEEALSAFPSSYSYLYLRSKSFYYISSYKNAIRDIEEALNIAPNEARFLAHYSKILLMQNKVIQAKEMIEKALEIDASESEYHLTLAVTLYMLDGESMANVIVNDVLAKEPHNLQALDIKQKYFTPKLKEKKSILKNLLFLDPFDKNNQRDMQFIKYYYKVLPPLMAIAIFLAYLLQSRRREFGFLEPICFVSFAVLGTLGSKDWRLNIPFIATLVSFDAYYNVGSRGISFGEVFYIVFQAGIFHLVFKGGFVLFKSLKYKFETRLEQQKNRDKNPLLYFLFKAPFEEYEELDFKAMKRYYIAIPVLIMVSLVLIYINMTFEYNYLKVFNILLFIYTAIRAYRVFWILTLYILFVILVTNGFSCHNCIWTFAASIFGAVAFAVPYKATRRFSWMRD